MKNSFSVLCSLYFAEKPDFLTSALKSIEAQSIQPDEVVVVQDGPLTNELLDVINAWKSRLPITTVVMEENVGLGKALNKGLSVCRNELVARIDTDDINRPNRFELQLAEFANDSSLAIVGSAIEEFNLLPGDLGLVRQGAITDSIKKQSVYKNPFNHMTVMFKKSLVLEVGSYQELHFMEDYSLWLRMIAAGYTTKNQEQVLVDARIGNGMIARRLGVKYVNSEYLLLRLKQKLKIASPFKLLVSFILRSCTRVLPVRVMSRIYKILLRKKARVCK
ncbi:glycosyltransferase [Psychrosphaera aquimarina]|uniref:Glycosyltransferase n=1 Tax=Psychrosphaera aquimarina TaxID=2044854 RepID=A0ABU3R4F3_9GAMM|nr:glycosyltransferase [Psychrosphaera aquimarina]MDU0114547.1 glycosyltransferase [Psychrosphaera aquimarina]